jgi:class 3 adenylate cyclase
MAQRKIVTVLFCDVAGSTALGESLDAGVIPEPLSLKGKRAPVAAWRLIAHADALKEARMSPVCHIDRNMGEVTVLLA